MQLNIEKISIEDAAYFEKLIRCAIENGATDYDLDELDDHLIEQLRKGVDANVIVSCCERLVIIYSEYGKDILKAYAYNTLIGAHLKNNAVASVLKILFEALNFSIEAKAELPGRSIVEKTLPFIMCSNISIDMKLSVLAICCRLFEKFGCNDELIKAYINAAYMFSDNGAYQAAYRVLVDAEKVAKGIPGGESTVKVLSTLVGISLQEGDHEFCLKVGHDVMETLQGEELEAPTDLLANVATAYQRSKSPKEAIKIYEKLLSRVKSSEPVNISKIAMNLSICKRQLGDLEGAIKDEKVAREHAYLIDDDQESLLELELIVAKNHVEIGDYKTAIASLEAAARILDKLLSASMRLHFRRGLRERFVNRIEPIICALPQSEVVTQLLGALAVCRSNSVSDWMHLLDWSEDLYKNEVVPLGKKTEIKSLLSQITQAGAPFIYEYCEKYDDPFERIGRPSPWDDFCRISESLIVAYGIPRPYDEASLERKVELIEKRLREGKVLILSLRDSLFFVKNDNYYRYDLKRAEVKEYFAKLVGYRFHEVDTREMAKSIDKTASMLTAAMEAADENLKFSDDCQFIYMPDMFDRYSFIPSLMAINRRKRKLDTLAWMFRVSPVLYERKLSELTIQKLVGIPDEPAELLLAESELTNIAKILNNATCVIINKNHKKEFLEAMKTADVLAVTTHGFPIANFIEPFVANLGGPNFTHVVDTDTIQREFIAFPYSLVLINSCHSAASMPARYSNRPSYDMASFPVLMLMNKKSSIVASSWKTLDKASYIFSHIFFNKLKESRTVDSAYMETLHKLAVINSKDAFDILSGIEGQRVKEESIAGLRPEVLQEMLNHPYCYGTFQLYTLF